MKVLVIGGGVLGTTTAYYLASDGHRVTLVDRARTLAAECSFANGGMLHAGNTEPWNTPDAIGRMIRWIGREDSPLLLRPGQIPNLVGWGLGFLRYSRAGHHERSTRINTRLAVYSQRMMAELRQATGITYDDARRGIVKIFRDNDELRNAISVSHMIESLGVRFEVMDRNELIRTEPVLDDIRGELAGGIYYPDDESGDPHQFTRRLGQLAAELGADLRLNEHVTAIRGDGGGITRVETDREPLTADRYVLAAGAEAPRLVRHLGVRLPIRPVKGYSATLPAAGHPGVPEVPIIDDSHKVVMARLGDRMRFSGTAEFAGIDRGIRPRRVEAVIRQAFASLPRYGAAVDTNEAQHWACLRPMTMDGPPILGSSRLPNLYLNTGSGHLGWTFAAGAAKVVADLVSDRAPEIDLDGLTCERFRRW